MKSYDNISVMKNNIIYVIAALIVGLGGGYLLFGGSSESDPMSHDHGEASDTDQMWTCSMHPQIMQPEKGDCPICGMDLIPAQSGTDGLAPDQFTLTENALALANVQTTVIGSNRSGETNTVNLSGKISENEEASAVQASYFDGRIERLHVNYEGQEVRKGQLLATIYSPELIAAQQELLTAASLKESQPSLYRAVRNKLKLWKLTEAQIDQIESAGEVTEFFPVYATVNGTVSQVLSSEGDFLKMGQPILRLNNLATVWAQFDAYENQLSLFELGQNIRILTSAFPDQSFESTISFIDPVLDNSTRTVTVRATLDNTDNLLKPGMFVTGSVQTVASGNESKILVPASAIMWTGKRSLVYVRSVSDQPIFEMREVMLGQKIGDQHEVTSGLSGGEEIVTNGTFTIDAAAQLQGKKSMMNKSGGRSMTGHEGHLEMEGHPDDSMSSSRMKMTLPETFQIEFQKIIPSYLNMKDALVASDAEKTADQAAESLKILTHLDLSELGEVESNKINSCIDLFGAMKDGKNLDDQRAAFVELNGHMVEMLSGMDTIEETLYVQRCPMANNNQGAVWLSTESEIRNPYFGDAMLKCGSVIDTLEKP